MSFFALPALIALFTKIWIYVLAKKAKHSSQTFLWLLSFFALHNLSEFLVASNIFKNVASNSLLRSYYAATLFLMAYMCIFAMSVASDKRHHKFNVFMFNAALFMSLLTLQTDWIIAGAVFNGALVTAVKGSYYFVFSLSVLSCFTFIFYILIRRYLKSTDIKVQLKCFYAGFALSPVIFISLIITVMMSMGYKYTAIFIMPIATTSFLFLVILTEKYNDLIRVRGRLPFSEQRKAEKTLLSIYRSHINKDLTLPEAKKDIERVLVQSALDRTQNNVTLAANTLGIQRGTLYSTFTRLGIKRGEVNDL